jgi:hypothetical protein
LQQSIEFFRLVRNEEVTGFDPSLVHQITNENRPLLDSSTQLAAAAAGLFCHGPS